MDPKCFAEKAYRWEYPEREKEVMEGLHNDLVMFLYTRVPSDFTVEQLDDLAFEIGNTIEKQIKGNNT